MKRKTIYVGVAWGLGLLLASFLHPAYDFIFLLFLLLACLLLYLIFKRSIKEIIVILTSMIVAFGSYACYDNFVYQKTVKYDKKEISFCGKILDVIDYSEGKSRYFVKGRINDEVKAKIYVYTDSYNCNINDYFEFNGTVKTPEDNYLFETTEYYKSNGIFLLSESVKNISITDNDDFSLKKIMADYRYIVSEFIKRNADEKQSAMLTGMLFGDKSGLSADDKTLFYRIGIGHVMAVSGLHLVLFCEMISLVLKRLKKNKYVNFFALEIMIFLFAVCSGLSPSVLRAALMMTLVNAAPLFRRNSDTLNSICISLILLTISNPFAIRNPSLILSLTGAFSAGVFAPYMVQNFKSDSFIDRQKKNIVYMFCVSLAIFPVSLICFKEGSFVSPIANIFLTPLCMSALFLAMISAILVFIKPVILIKLAGILCTVNIKIVRFIGKSRMSYMNFDERAVVISAILLLFCVFTYFMFKNRRTLAVSVCMCIVIFMSSVCIEVYDNRQNIKIAMLGDDEIAAIVVSDGICADVIDLNGDHHNTDYVKKYLQSENISEINNIFILRKQYAASASYNNMTSLFDIKRVVFPGETVFHNGTKICSVAPIYTDYKNVIVNYDRYKISINNTKLMVSTDKFSFVCDSECKTEKSDVYAVYDNIYQPPLCKTLIAPEYNSKNVSEEFIDYSNVYVTIERNGNFSVGRL